MNKFASAAALMLAANAVSAEDSRQLDAHEHGVGQLDIAFEGDTIAMELHAPGADIVGFEYAAESAEDRALVDAAVASLARPLDLFALPAAAGCSVVQASASLESEEDDHEEHAAHEEDENDHDDHAKDDGHNDDDHAAHEDDDHAVHEDDDHDDHAQEAGHTEFHAEYTLKCADLSQVTLITFDYFTTFPNALELEIQMISDKGATAFEVTRDAPTLDLRGMF